EQWSRGSSRLGRRRWPGRGRRVLRLGGGFSTHCFSFYRVRRFALQCGGPMNLVARQDRVLLGGLAVALIVVFARPIRYLLDLAREVERSSGLALMPALIILTVVFVFHQQGKRQEAKARAAAAEADARLADARATELEWLVTFGQALGRALD